MTLLQSILAGAGIYLAVGLVVLPFVHLLQSRSSDPQAAADAMADAFGLPLWIPAPLEVLLALVMWPSVAIIAMLRADDAE